jgi:hypothetical protein
VRAVNEEEVRRLVAEITVEPDDGLIKRETRFYAEPFEPPERRAQWALSADS